MRERVQKILAAAGLGSRRKCEELIAAGRVTVNRVVIKLGDRADATVDDVRVDGTRIPRFEEKKYYVINKPRNLLSTVSDPKGRPTVVELVPGRTRVYPVGRLDQDVEGLMLLTNDGALANRLLHPRYETPKTYHATLSRDISPRDIARLREGLRIRGRRVAIDHVRVHTPAHVEITLHEGRKHIVKRIFKKLGYVIARLKRTGFANLQLGTLPSGAYRELSKDELLGLRRLLTNEVQQSTRPADPARSRLTTLRTKNR